MREVLRPRLRSAIYIYRYMPNTDRPVYHSFHSSQSCLLTAGKPCSIHHNIRLELLWPRTRTRTRHDRIMVAAQLCRFCHDVHLSRFRFIPYSRSPLLHTPFTLIIHYIIQFLQQHPARTTRLSCVVHKESLMRIWNTQYSQIPLASFLRCP